MTTTTAAPTIGLVDVDPRTLLVDLNVRSRAALDEAFVESIREHGVLVPIVAVPAEGDALRVRYGQRRTLAAIEADRATVPVVVVEGEIADDERIVRQWHENELRAGLSTSDKIGAVEQLALLGLTAGDIAKRTRSTPAAVEQAIAAAGSTLARKSADRYQLTLDQAAAVAEFADEKGTAQALIVAAQKGGEGEFAHVLQLARDSRVEAAAVAEARAELEKAGVPIVDQVPRYANTAARHLDDLTDAAGKKMRPRSHAKCPGHAAFVSATWQGVRAVYVCTDWKANGHRDAYARATTSTTPTTAAAADPDAAREERREVLTRNKEWRSAETVRRQWLTTFLARKTPPADAGRYVAGEIAARTSALEHAIVRGHNVAGELLGLADVGRAVLVEAIATASSKRGEVIGLGLVLGAVEASIDVQAWRHPSDTVQRYFAFLTANGYTPSEVEQIAAEGARRGK